ncbi:hypothetical protein FJY93_01020 [Candidatus Kaiserbacteria bacterium]|nr:hypothetical protein [Candidatus Kaiserbacteria bacterium]
MSEICSALAVIHRWIQINVMVVLELCRTFAAAKTAWDDFAITRRRQCFEIKPIIVDRLLTLVAFVTF